MAKYCLICVFLAFFCGVAIAGSYDVERLATAIKYAENSPNYKPYGIIKDYCTPQTEEKCRKGCIQTINHALRDWDGKGDFIEFLGSRYCPVSAHKLNKNWVKNVRYFYGY